MQKINHTNINSPLSKLSFGGASISGEGRGYGFGEISESSAIDLLLEAYDKGITVFDTAPIYGFNTSEIRMGKAFKSIRDKVTLVSKAGVTWHDNMRVDMSNDPKVISKMLENSLRHLNTDYIDIYMVHWPDKNVDIRHSLEVLEKAQSQGKIKNIGLCNSNDEELKLGQEVCQIDVLQSEFNFFNNGYSLFKEADLSKYYKMGWGSLDKGILAGKLKADQVFDKSDCRSWAPWWKKSNWKEKVQKVENLKKEIQDFTPLELTMSYLLNTQFIDSPIFGARNSKQLNSLVDLMNTNVNEDYLLKAKEILNS